MAGPQIRVVISIFWQTRAAWEYLVDSAVVSLLRDGSYEPFKALELGESLSFCPYSGRDQLCDS